MSEPSIADMLADQTSRLLQAGAGRDVILAAEAGSAPEGLWAEIEALGLPQAAAPEAAGGHGLAWPELSGTLQAVGYFAAPAPIIETMIAAWLLAKGGLEAGPGPLILAPGVVRLTAGGRLDGVTDAVAWPAWGASAALVVRDDAGATRVALGSAPKVEPGARGRVDWGEVRPDAVSAPLLGLAVGNALPALAVARAAQIAGGLQRALDLSVAYALDRSQFGQPIAKFQAVQHMVARVALEAAAAASAADFGLRTLEKDPLLAAAVAKTRTGRAAGTGAALAHQVHGAIGVTHEHDLQIFTRRLLQWRDEGGSEGFWAEQLGQEVAGWSRGRLWPTLIDRLAAAG